MMRPLSRALVRTPSSLARAWGRALPRMRAMPSSSSSLSGNVLLSQAGLPKFGAVKAAHVAPALDHLLGILEADFAALEATLDAKLRGGGTASYGEVVEALEVLEAPLDYAWGTVNHLTGVMNSDELRAAHRAAQPRVIAATSRLAQSSVVFRALLQVGKTYVAY